MTNTGLARFADALIFAHGTHAPAEAAMHLRLAEKTGNDEMAAIWRELEGHLAAAAKSDFRQAA